MQSPPFSIQPQHSRLRETYQKVPSTMPYASFNVIASDEMKDLHSDFSNAAVDTEERHHEVSLGRFGRATCRTHIFLTSFVFEYFRPALSMIGSETRRKTEIRKSTAAERTRIHFWEA